MPWRLVPLSRLAPRGSASPSYTAAEMMYFTFMYLVSDTAVSEQAVSDRDQVASVDQPDDTASALDHTETTHRVRSEGDQRKHVQINPLEIAAYLVLIRYLDMSTCLQ